MVINIAQQEVGYAESPPQSNKTKYGQWFGLDGVPWCAVFVSWCYFMAGNPLPKIGWPKGFASCQAGFDHFVAENKITSTPIRGDLVFFDWDNNGNYDHVGLFVHKINDEFFSTIEGNTSLKDQRNGGEVMQRVRKFNNVVFVHP